jgi:hypothetical protein
LNGVSPVQLCPIIITIWFRKIEPAGCAPLQNDGGPNEMSWLREG